MKTQEEKDIRNTNILARAEKLSGLTFANYEEAEDWMYYNAPVDERHECDVKNIGRDQRVDFQGWWTQGDIIDFSDHWHKAPGTEIEHEKFINDEGKVIQLYYVVEENEFNTPPTEEDTETFSINVRKIDGTKDSSGSFYERDYLQKDGFESIDEARDHIEKNNPVIDCIGYIYTISDSDGYPVEEDIVKY